MLRWLRVLPRRVVEGSARSEAAWLRRNRRCSVKAGAKVEEEYDASGAPGFDSRSGDDEGGEAELLVVSEGSGTRGSTG